MWSIHSPPVLPCSTTQVGEHFLPITVGWKQVMCMYKSLYSTCTYIQLILSYQILASLLRMAWAASHSPGKQQERQTYSLGRRLHYKRGSCGVHERAVASSALFASRRPSISHLTETFIYPNEFLAALGHRGSDNQGFIVDPSSTNNTCSWTGHWFHLVFACMQVREVS